MRLTFWLSIGLLALALSACGPALSLPPADMVNYRDHHGNTKAADWQMRVEPVAHGLRVTAFEGAVPFYLLSDHAEAVSQHECYRGYFLSVEGYRGLNALDDNLYAGLFQATLRPGESLTIVASTDAGYAAQPFPGRGRDARIQHRGRYALVL